MIQVEPIPVVVVMFPVSHEDAGCYAATTSTLSRDFTVSEQTLFHSIGSMRSRFMVLSFTLVPRPSDASTGGASTPWGGFSPAGASGKASASPPMHPPAAVLSLGRGLRHPRMLMNHPKRCCRRSRPWALRHINCEATP